MVINWITKAYCFSYRDTSELFSFEILVGSDRQNYIQHTEWLVSCNPKVYDCFTCI